MKNKLVSGLTLLTKIIPSKMVQNICGDITPIFMLHRMANSDQSVQEKELKHIEWCLEYIRKHKYHPITLNQLSTAYRQGKTIPPKSVVFTLDDGFWDQYEVAAPLFNRFDIPYTCFVITDFLDGKLWPWDDQISYILRATSKSLIETNLPNGDPVTLDFSKFESIGQIIDYLRGMLKIRPQKHLYTWLDEFYEVSEVDKPRMAPEKDRAMTWEQAQKLIEQGHDIAPHTKTHRILSQLDDLEAEQEIYGSFERVNEKLEGASSLFAYPTGRPQDYTKREINILSQIGAISTVNTTPNYSRNTDPIHELARFALPHNRFDFVQYLSFFDQFKRKMLHSRYAD